MPYNPLLLQVGEVCAQDPTAQAFELKLEAQAIERFSLVNILYRRLVLRDWSQFSARTKLTLYRPFPHTRSQVRFGFLRCAAVISWRKGESVSRDEVEEDDGSDGGQSGGAELHDVDKAKLSQPTLNMVELPNR